MLSSLKINNQKVFTMDESSDHTGGERLYDALPFIESFPFDEYDISLEKIDVIDATHGISPILVKEFEPFESNNTICFQYFEMDANHTVTFSEDDVLDISESSDLIEILSPVRKYLKMAIDSVELREKVQAIRKSKKFIQQLDLEYLLQVEFGEILGAILEIYGGSLTSQEKLAIIRLNLKKIDEHIISDQNHKIAKAFLNFQLHYAMIILGIVIATKIH